MDDCGELHDDMCAYFEFAGNAAVAEGKKVRTRSKSLVQEQVRARLFADGEEVVGRRVCKVVDKTLCHGEVRVRAMCGVRVLVLMWQHASSRENCTVSSVIG